MSILETVGDAWQAWGKTDVFEAPASDYGKIITENITESVQAVTKVVRETPAVAFETIKSVPQAVENILPVESIKTAVNSELFAKTILLGFGTTCVGLGANYIYKGLTQNCSIRKITKAPISLLPKKEGVENEQLSVPLGWIDRICSIVKRVGFPAAVSFLPILGGGIVLSNLEELASYFPTNSD